MKVIVLTGAGISAESGIRTFRGADGLWEGYQITDVASPGGFKRDPKLVYRFYNERRKHLLEPTIQPNAAHRALAKLETKFGDDFLLITQNIDDLHQRSGHRRIIPMHGELRKTRCDKCSTVSPWDGDFDASTACPKCGISGGLRPHVVWFGETPLQMDRIYAAFEDCRLFAAIGTSGVVYPASGLVEIADSVNAHTVELNLEPSHVHSIFSEKRYGPATEVVPQWVDEIIREFA